MSLTSRIRRIPVVGSALSRAFWGGRALLWRAGGRFAPHNISSVDLQAVLPSHVPNSRVPSHLLDGIILESAERLPQLMNELGSAAGLKPPTAITTAEFAQLLEADPERIAALGKLLADHGSDKSTGHDYHLIYGAILDPDLSSAILEIGLGTNDPSIPSTMGADGRPGASLRAFRDFLQHAECFGADIDQKTLFKEDRITTLLVDQLSSESVERLFADVGQPLDLIIDDGLHAPTANLSVLIEGLEHLRPGGWLVIEDIGAEKRDIWELAGKLLLSDSRDAFLITTKARLVFAMRRRF